MKTRVVKDPVPVEPATPDLVRVLVQEIPAPGETAEIQETSFDDVRSIAAARKSRPGGYLRLPIQAVRAVGKSVILLSRVVRGTDLILRVRLFPTPVTLRGR